MAKFRVFIIVFIGLHLTLHISFAVAQKKSQKPVILQGKASYYGDEFDGRKTANGEIFRNADFTAAHRTFPFNTYLRVTNLKNNLSVTVRVNDRGPFVKTRIIDLSESAARRIGSYMHGLASVKIEILNIIQHTKEIDSIFQCNEVLDCLGNPETLHNNSISLWKTNDLIHMLYVANELYLQEDIDKVLIVAQGLKEKRIYNLVITDIETKILTKERIDYFEKKGFMNVRIFK